MSADAASSNLQKMSIVRTKPLMSMPQILVMNLGLSLIHISEPTRPY